MKKYRVVEDGNGLFSVEIYDDQYNIWFGSIHGYSNLDDAKAKLVYMVNETIKTVVYEVEA